MNEIRLFEHGEFGQLRIVERDGEHWFVAKDVCSALGLGNNRQAVSRLDEDEKRVISSDTPGGKQELQAVNEPGLYSLVLSSRKPEAKAFKRWVTHEVLPAIRKDGGYMVARDETPEETMARALLMADSTIRRQRALIADLEPRAELGEAMSAADGSMSVTKATRHIASLYPWVTRDWVFDTLRRHELVCKGDNSPTRHGIDTGRVRAVSSTFTGRDGVERQGGQYAHVTPKGIEWLLSAARAEGRAA